MVREVDPLVLLLVLHHDVVSCVWMTTMWVTMLAMTTHSLWMLPLEPLERILQFEYWAKLDLYEDI